MGKNNENGLGKCELECICTWNVFAHYKVQLRFYGDCGKHMVVPLPTGNFLNQWKIVCLRKTMYWRATFYVASTRL
jgi:hypothetical protein